MMKLRNDDILRAAYGFALVVQDLSDNAKAAPIDLQRRVGRTAKKLENDAALISKQRAKIVRAHALKDESGAILSHENGNPRFDAAGTVACEDAVEAFLAAETELDAYVQPFTAKELTLDGMRLAAKWSAFLDGSPLLTD